MFFGWVRWGSMRRNNESINVLHQHQNEFIVFWFWYRLGLTHITACHTARLRCICRRIKDLRHLRRNLIPFSSLGVRLRWAYSFNWRVIWHRIGKNCAFVACSKWILIKQSLQEDAVEVATSSANPAIRNERLTKLHKTRKWIRFAGGGFASSTPRHSKSHGIVYACVCGCRVLYFRLHRQANCILSYYSTKQCT